MKFSELFKNGQRQRTSVKSDFKKFLRQNNCKSNEQYNKEDKSTHILFDYQGGHFIADIKDNNRGVDITYPGITSMPTDELPLARTLCNHYNASNTLLRFTYSLSEEDNRVHVHMAFFANTVWPDELPDNLAACFHFQRQFCDEYQKMRQTAQETNSDDLELDHQQMLRERYLISEQEISHQPGTPAEWHFNAPNLPSCTQLLEKILGIKEVKYDSATLDTGSSMTGDEICNIDLSHLVASNEHEKVSRTLTFKITLGDDTTPRFAVMHISPDDAAHSDNYYRITATLIPSSNNRAASINSEPQLPTCNSVVVSLNDADADKMMAEFDYMWKDAVIKRRDGEQLNEMQQLLADITDANLGYCLYWGRKLMLNEQYYDSLRHLENAFNAFRTSYLDMNKELRNVFLEVCYYIGVCYAALHLYRDAYYYLDYLRNDGNVRHTSELINTLANGKDFRLFAITDELMKAIREQYAHDEDIPENLMSFINFMRRRRAYALIDHHQLDEAETAFTAMLDDPENSDYALGELAYIKQLRQNDNNTEIN